MKKIRNIFIALTLAAVCSVGVAFANWQTGEGGGPNYANGSFNGSSTEPVARIGTTYYASINKAIDDGVLGMCYPSTYLHEYDGTVASITQDNTNAWVDPSVLTISYASASTSYVPSGSYTTGLPTNAGYYVVKIGASNGYATTHTINCRISPKVIYIKDTCSYALDYDSSARTSATLINAVTNLQFTDNQTTQSTYSFTSYVIAGIDNGMYYYPNSAISSSQSAIYSAFVNKCNSAGMLTGPQSGITNVVGSTYAVTVASTNSNYEIANRCILKYKTALVGSTYYTIEDALALSGTTIVTFAGDSTNATSYVATGFCALTDENPYSQTRTYAMSKNMVVNYQSGTGTSYGTGTATSGGFVYSALIIPSNVTINIASSYSLTVNGILGFAQPNTSATTTRGVILNNGTVNLSGNLYAYGYVKGTGLINCESGSKIYETFRSYDWPGGNTASTTYSKLIPMNAWGIHNVSCTSKIKYGAKLYAQYYGFQGNAPCPLILSNSTSDNCVFVIKNSSSYVLKKAMPAATNPNDTSLSLINGSNQTLGQRDIIELYGDFQDSTISLNVYVTISTSTSIACPVGFMSVYLKNSDSSGNTFASTLNISKSDFLFLPGTSMTIESGTTLTTSSGADLIFETWAHSYGAEDSTDNAFKSKCKDQYDAKLVVNGTVNANGSIGGNVVTTSTTGKIVTGSGFAAVTFYVLNKGVGASGSGNMAYKVTSMYSMAHINQVSTLNNFAASKTYTTASDTNGNYYFVGTAGTVAESSLPGTFASNGVTSSDSCLLPDTLITMADGTKKAVKDIQAGDLVLVFNHETGQLDVAPITFNDHDEASLFTVLYLNFSNGKSVGVISEHGFFDLDTMRYEYIREDNYQEFIGHRFYTEEGDEAILTSVDVRAEYTECYSPTSFYHFDYFVEGMLSMPGGITGLFNIFEFGSNLKYDEEAYNHDIETYGLFTYEDLAPLGVTEIMFEAYAGKYLKVALGKGILTEEYLAYLIERYGSFTEEP